MQASKFVPMVVSLVMAIIVFLFFLLIRDLKLDAYRREIEHKADFQYCLDHNNSYDWCYEKFIKY